MQIEQFLDVLSFNFLSYLVNNDISSLQNFSFDNVYFGNCEELKLTSNIYENIIFMGGSHFLMCVLFFFLSFFFTTVTNLAIMKNWVMFPIFHINNQSRTDIVSVHKTRTLLDYYNTEKELIFDRVNQCMWYQVRYIYIYNYCIYWY